MRERDKSRPTPNKEAKTGDAKLKIMIIWMEFGAMGLNEITLDMSAGRGVNSSA